MKKTKLKASYTRTFDDCLAEDARIQKVFSKFKDSAKDCRQYTEEIMSLHARRDLRTLNVTALIQSSLHIGIKNNIENAATRSRVTEIKMKVTRLLLDLEETLSTLRSYCFSTYATELMQEAKTLADRKSMVDHGLASLIKSKKRLEAVITLSDILLQDLDSAAYTLHRVGELLNIRAKDR